MCQNVWHEAKGSGLMRRIQKTLHVPCGVVVEMVGLSRVSNRQGAEFLTNTRSVRGEPADQMGQLRIIPGKALGWVWG